MSINQIRKVTPKDLYYLKQSTGAKGWLLNQHHQKLKNQMNSLPLFTLNCISKVGNRVGIGEATLFRWLQDSGFQEVYREAKQRIVNHAITQLQRASGNAVKVLTEVMNDGGGPASSRVTAARIVLDMAIRALELEGLEARVKSLEEHILK